MQTFLPDRDFAKSAEFLDDLRLNKQAVEVKQIYRALTDPDAKGWKNHPATLMWKGCENLLLVYGFQMANEWIVRGHQTKLFDEFKEKIILNRCLELRYPVWLGDERLHSSHRKSLLSKNFHWYKHFGWPETESVLAWYEENNWEGQAPYENFWPTKHSTQSKEK